MRTLKKMLTSLWFDLCGRGGCSSSSSAFEHVFVGEIKGQRQGENEVSGFHNWIQVSARNVSAA
jgi:poly(U)-specific endoribonuclease